MQFNKLLRLVFCSTAMAFSILGGLTASFGKDPVPTLPNPLPTTAPAPNILMRESFGQGPDFARPGGGNGQMKPAAQGGVSFNGFWLEYPGTKNNRWTTTDSGETWRFCGINVNPNELPSPLQPFEGINTCLCTYLNATFIDQPRATALIPMSPAGSAPYEVNIDAHYGFPSVNPYIALGLTNSAVTTSNLKNGGNIVLVMFPADPAQAFIQYELRLGGFQGELLATGVVEDDDNFIGLRLRFNPQTRSMGASIKGMDIGTFQTNVAAPRYAAFEGYGWVDNFTVTRQ